MNMLKLKSVGTKMTISKKFSVFIIFFMVSHSMFAQYELGKYHIMQYRANVRMEPTRNSDVIAILSLHDEIEILENSDFYEEINGVMSFWFKIKYGNIIGYTFGGNIAYKTFITDIDNNGIKDYFYVRYSSYNSIYPLNDDIVIYINNERINITTLKTIAHNIYYHRFDECDFFKGSNGNGAINYVIIVFKSDGGDHGKWRRYYFQVTMYGRIEYIGNGGPW